MTKKTIKAVFYTLIVIFILIILEMFTLGMEIGIIRTITIYSMFILWFLFFSLGIILVVLTYKSKVKGKLKIYLLLTGISSLMFPIGAVLHNVFYAFAIMLENIIILKYLMNILEVIFFLMSVPISPILFLIGIIGSMILFRKERENE